VHFALSAMIFYLNIDLFFFFSCSLAGCFSFIYLFIYPLVVPYNTLLYNKNTKMDRDPSEFVS